MKRFLQQFTPGLLFVCLHLLASPGLAQVAQPIITTYAGGAPIINGAPAIDRNLGYPYSVVSDGAGGCYFTSPGQHRVYRVAASGALTIVAGNGEGGFSGDGGPAVSAQLSYPQGVAVDGMGNVFIADTSNLRIRMVTPAGIITTVAGNGTLGFSGDGGPADSARIGYPRGIAADSAGDLLIADGQNYRIRKVTPAGVISTVAGNGTYGFSGDGGPATSAQLSNAHGVAVDAAGNIFIADAGNYRIRKVTSAGVISTVAGNGTYGFSGDGGPATSAQIGIEGIEADSAGAIFISDGTRIRKVTPSGIISTVAGNGKDGFNGDGGPAIAAQFGYLPDLAVDAAGNLFIADPNNLRIRKVTPDGIVSTVAGTIYAGDGGPATLAVLYYPGGVAVDGGGNVFIADSSNYRIRKVTPAGIIDTFAGNGTSGTGGNGGRATSAQLSYPAGIAADAAGNVFIADYCAGPIRKVNSAGIITAFGDNDAGGRCDYYYDYFAPAGVAVDAAGNLFVAEPAYHRVRKVTPAGTATTVAGNEAIGFSGDGGLAVSAQLSHPNAVAVDAAGNLLIVDSGNYRIRKVTPAGVISTVAGNGINGFSGDGGPAASARLSYVNAVAVDATGNLFIADSWNYCIRMVTPDGVISTVAGNGNYGFSGDGGPAATAQLSYPSGVAIDAAGTLFIADTNNDRIRTVANTILPTLVGVSPNLGLQGATVTVSLSGINFSSPFSINAGSDITAGAIDVVTAGLVTATLTIAPNAALGERFITVVTAAGTSTNAASFTVVTPFPDLSITSSHMGNLSVGSNGTFSVSIGNVGTAAATGGLTVTDTLPLGLTFVSGTGGVWSCAASGQTVTCMNPGSLAVGASTTFTLTVAVGRNAAPQVVHTPTVMVAGDLIASNNTASDTATVVIPVPTLSGISPDLGFLGAKVTVSLSGANFYSPLSINAGSGITVGAINIVSAGLVTATLTIASNAAVGARPMMVVTGGGTSAAVSFTVVQALPDLSITSFHSGNLLVGSNGTFTIGIVNGGAAAAVGGLTVTDVLPSGLTFVSGNGIGWSCAASGQIVTCLYPASLAVGAYTTFMLTVAVGGSAASQVVHAPTVTVAGDPVLSNNTATDTATVVIPAPGLTGISPNSGLQGAIVTVSFTGTNFSSPLHVNAGSGITVGAINVVTAVLATATLTIATDAAVGARPMTVVTGGGTSAAASFTVVEASPDLSITSFHTGNLFVGTDGIFSVGIVNGGTAAAAGGLTVTDVLPLGLTFVSGTGSGWSCAATGQAVTCLYPGALARGASTNFTLTVAVGGSAASQVVHTPAVTGEGDASLSNNSASDAVTVVALALQIQLEPSLAAGRQSTVSVTLPIAFPVPVTGTLKLEFSPDSATSGDDPAIQFATGGREVPFTIPANELQARFGAHASAGPLGFQPGSLAGTLTFSGIAQAGGVQAKVSATQIIPKQAPAIQSAQTDTKSGFALLITLLSTAREVSEMNLAFATTPAVQLGCGAVKDCAVSGTTLTFNVKPLFDAWFSGNAALGSLTILRLPFEIRGNVRGTVAVTLRNGLGPSNSVSFPLP